MTDNELRIRSALMDNYHNYAQGLDTKDWSLVRACFADEVLIDYGDISAPSGDPNVPRLADDWLLHLQSVINSFHITRHAISNHRFIINQSQVSCRAYLSADHVLFPDPQMPIVTAQDVVTVVGEYTNYYTQIDDAWKISKSELAVHYSSGNIALFMTAAERIAAQQRD
ncbi:MAG: nuclear transport factor 2 family protein [Halioglobus sp.]